MEVERRIDPDDGLSYTYNEFTTYYKGKYKKNVIDEYWRKCCPAPTQAASKAKAKAKGKAKGKAATQSSDHPTETLKATPVGEAPQNRSRQPLKRSRSWLVKVGGITLLPCEEELLPIVEDFVAKLDAGDAMGMDDAQLRLLQAHPFVTSQTKSAKSESLATGVDCTSYNFKMDVRKFQKWLKTPAGSPFEEKGKGYDDGCYLTSAVLRAFMPRGYTTFVFTNAGGETVTVVLRGFLKFTGVSATDEDEESGATSETDAFMFHGFRRSDASRFAVTTKSNGENGKYTMRKVFGEWYGFAGSKNTGMVWKLDQDATALYPIPKDTSNGGAAQVGPKIVSVIHGLLKGMADSTRTALLEALHEAGSTIMVELNDPEHEHIFPIETLFADHVAILNRSGYPLPQHEAYAFFDRFGLQHVACTLYDDMDKLEAVMEDVRSSTETEGAVIYLERNDDKPVGLVKVKSDYYVIARRTRETMRGALISQVSKNTPVDEAMQATRKRLSRGMQDLKHISGCAEHHQEWSSFAIAFAESWAKAYKDAHPAKKSALIREFHAKYGSMYMHFWKAWQAGKKDMEPLLLLDKQSESSM